MTKDEIMHMAEKAVYTTLNKIRAHRPCLSGWEKLLQNLGKTQADDEPLSMLTILNSNGLDDALWCLRACDGIEREARLFAVACDGIEREARLFAVACVRRVQHLMTDKSINALDVAERYAHGQATADELRAAMDAAKDVWAAAEWAAWDAAGDAARAAERAWQEQEFKRVFCGDEK